MEPDNIEINLIGTGGGYGESLVIHIGNDEWIVVDSCQNPKTGNSIPLEFLKQKSVDFNKVKLIVCTHWHDDHIRGIADLLDNCPKAIFSFARATDLKKFLRLVSIDLQKSQYSVSNASTNEFNKCLDIVHERNDIVKPSFTDRLLYSTTYNKKTIQIHSLSPSDLSSRLFDEEISTLISKFEKRNKKLPYQSPNDRSVVLLIQCGSHNILLGSDLEI